MIFSLCGQICFWKDWPLGWDNISMYWALRTHLTMPKPFAHISAFHPQTILWGRSSNFVPRKLKLRKVNKSPPRLSRRVHGAGPQQSWGLNPDSLAPASKLLSTVHAGSCLISWSQNRREGEGPLLSPESHARWLEHAYEPRLWRSSVWGICDPLRRRAVLLFLRDFHFPLKMCLGPWDSAKSEWFSFIHDERKSRRETCWLIGACTYVRAYLHSPLQKWDLRLFYQQVSNDRVKAFCIGFFN